MGVNRILNMNASKRNQTVKRIVRSVRKYNLTVRRFECRANQSTMSFDYHISAARRHSGIRGGYLRNRRYWVVANLMPEHRAVIDALPKESI